MEKGVYGVESLKAFIDSPTCEDIMKFVEDLNTNCKGVKNNATQPTAISNSLVGAIERVTAIANEVEPLRQTSRFGNKAFRTFCAALADEANGAMMKLCNDCDVEASDALIAELAAYWQRSFGEPSRLDYGTGHECAFLFFLCAITKARLADNKAYASLALIVFPKYLELVRFVQLRYSLEPAGSHGVWSLDDYQFLPFVFGSSQLNRDTSDPEFVAPRSFKQEPFVQSQESNASMFVDAIKHILYTKTGSLSEHSPIISDILNLRTWEIVNKGMILLFKAEVLGKHPVAQHFVFGRYLPISWDVVDRESNAQPNPFLMAQLQQSVVPGVNPQATDIVSKYFVNKPQASNGTPMPQINMPYARPPSAPQVDYTLLPDNTGITINEWSIKSSISRINSEEEMGEIERKYSWAKFPPPEQFFGSNTLQLDHSSGFSLQFNAVDALHGCILPTDEATGESKPDRKMFKVVHADKWANRTDLNGNTIQEWRHDFDWTYTTVYQGTLDNGELAETEEQIDYHRLKIREPILWFNEIILFEDDLFDTGVSKLSAKIRVMPSGWFVLLRCWVRVDGTFVRIYDSRFSHFFDSSPSKLLCEFSKKEASFDELRAARKPCDSKLLTEPNQVAEFLPEIEHKKRMVQM